MLSLSPTVSAYHSYVPCLSTILDMKRALLVGSGQCQDNT